MNNQEKSAAAWQQEWLDMQAQRDALLLRVKTMVNTLEGAAAQFDSYGDQHAAKKTPEASEKARVNRDWAETCRKASRA